MGAVIMVQGTSSDAGKSILCAALCRFFAEAGYSVAPFKAQNMALNAMCVAGGGEIGWAQVMQAEAAAVEPTVAMNPILLKPVSDTVCQIIVNGVAVGEMSAAEYLDYKKSALPTVLMALDFLRSQYDVVVIEGAGSPAEVNLREHDIVNMRLAQAAKAPVILVTDIDRGGMFAYVVGTLALLTEHERALIQGVVVNKFRGSKERLQPGLEQLTALTEKQVIGVIPYLNGLSLPAEDSLSLNSIQARAGGLDVAVIRLPRIANFTDYHILGDEDGVHLRYVSDERSLGSPHLIILPGTKNTISDLCWLKEKGLAQAIINAANQGKYVVGICGGYQMLGTVVKDLENCEGTGGVEEGLGLLPVETTFQQQKTTVRVRGKTIAFAEDVEGYEIHLGKTSRCDLQPFATLTTEDGRQYQDGAVSADGRLFGTYLHGLFDSASFRTGFLNRIRKANQVPVGEAGGLSAHQKRERSYSLLAAAVRKHLDTTLLLNLIRQQLEEE